MSCQWVIVGQQLAHVERFLYHEQMFILLEHLVHFVIAHLVFPHQQVELELEHVVGVGQLEYFSLEHDVVEAAFFSRALRG